MTIAMVNIVKVFAPTAIAFFFGILITPFLTNFLYKYKCWKKQANKIDTLGNPTPIFDELDKERAGRAPRMGGIIIWASTLITILLFWLISIAYPTLLSEKLNFLSRNQTWLPLFTLLCASLLGLVDDILQVTGEAGAKSGLSFSKRLGVVAIIGLVGGWWFFTKLDPAIHIPFAGLVNIGWWFIPLFVFVMIVMFSSSVIDGLDGLSGGVMAIIFTAYACIAFFQNQIDLAAFCAAIAGSTLAFLWFNIPPARFYMSETGILGLTTTLTVVAFLTNSVLFLPLIAFPLVISGASSAIQITSKKFFGRKVFLVAPLHHHFEAMGWPAYKVVMRYWVITVITAIIGMILVLISK